MIDAERVTPDDEAVVSELIPAHCLAIATIRLEADSEPFEGKLAVAEVIRNRMAMKHFSDGTVAGTVFRPAQFSCWNTADSRRDDICRAALEEPLTIEALRAWAESGHPTHAPLLPPDTTHYFNPKLAAPSWKSSLVFVRAIGAHDFYRQRRTGENRVI